MMSSRSSSESPLSLGRLLCVGIRGARPGDPVLEADLRVCAEAGIGAVILFDVDVPRFRRLLHEGVPHDRARLEAPRNVLGPEQLRELVGHVRRTLGDDVFVTIDQEGGNVARLAGPRGFRADPPAEHFVQLAPRQRRILARRQVEQLRAMDVDWNFAPCVDLAIEPRNTIITRLGRSFGADPQIVVEAASVVLDAHETAGIVATLKHFPGHGSSVGDTHLGLVDITATWRRDAELAPYRALGSRPGVAIMVAHVVHRDLDPDRPASLSPAVIDGLLRTELGFDGVVVTDSVDMGAIAARWTTPEAAVAAIDAGADLVIDAFNLDDRQEHPASALVAALEAALREGRIRGGRARVERSLRRLDRLRAFTR